MWKTVGWPSQGPICEAKRRAKPNTILLQEAMFRQQRISTFPMTCMIIFYQKIPLHSGKHRKARLKVDAKYLRQWMVLLNPVKFPMPFPILIMHAHQIMKNTTKKSEINFLLGSSSTIQLVTMAQ